MPKSSQSSLERLARERWAALEKRLAEAKQAKLEDLPLGEYIEALSKRVKGAYGKLLNPKHLAEVVEIFERIERGEEVRVLIDTPPQHGKTAILIYGIVRYLKRHPDHNVVYVTYNQTVADACSYQARLIAQAAGLELASDRITDWRTTSNGSFMATSPAGPLTGRPGVRIIIVDDPYAGRVDAESQVYRAKLREWFSSGVESRDSPGMSVVVCHTRWVPPDLIGELGGLTREPTAAEKASGKVDAIPIWERIHKPAVDSAGGALWPEFKPLEWLEGKRQRMSEYDWYALFMGEPRPRGASLFNDARYFERLPTGYRVAIGVDLAYTAKTHADYSVAVVLAEKDEIFYLLDVVRMQVPSTVFGERLKTLADTYPGAKMLAYAYGPEMGNIDWLRKEKVPIKGRSMTGDKFLRAQPVSGAWQRGRVLLPRTRGAVEQGLPPALADKPPPWLDAFVSEVVAFTGVSDPHDDQVDAMAPAYDLLAKPKPSGGGGSVGSLGARQSFEERPIGL